MPNNDFSTLNVSFCCLVYLGTPFNYSRRESLSSLSCDDSDEDGEVNITIINRVNAAMMKRMQENKAAATGTASAANQMKADKKAAGPSSAMENNTGLCT